MATINVNGQQKAVSGSNIYVGGGGTDYTQFNLLDYRGSPGAIFGEVSANGFFEPMALKNGWGGIDSIVGIQVLFATPFNDHLIMKNVTENGISVETFAGDDVVDGSQSSDTNVGFYWSPTGIYVDLEAGYALDGWGGRDTLINVHHVESASSWNDTLLGSDDYDVFEPSAGDDYIDGRGGFNVVMYSADWSMKGPASKGIDADFVRGTVYDSFGGTDTIRNVNSIIGSKFDDRIAGDDKDNDFFGYFGNDYIDGRGGVDSYAVRPLALPTDRMPAYVNLAMGTAHDGTGGFDELRNIENVELATPGFATPKLADVVIGDAGNNQVIIRSGAGVVVGSGGNDTIVGSGLPLTVFYDGSIRDFSLQWGADGSLRVIKPNGVDWISQVTEVIFRDTSFKADRSSGRSASDLFTGSTGDETRIGTGHSDKFFHSLGRDLVVGGDGLDILLVSGTSKGASFSQVSTGYLKISGSGFSHLTASVERLQFEDTTLAFDEGAGQVYRLYQAAFSRTPDKGGLSYWVDKMDDGLSLRDIVYGFINSVEFQKAYGNSLTNAQLVVQLYTNILGRAPEKAGADYWIGELDRGTSRLDVFASISESGENKTKLAAIIGQGIELDTAIVG